MNGVFYGSYNPRWGSEEDYNKNPEENNDRVEGGFYGSYNPRWGSEEDYNKNPEENNDRVEGGFYGSYNPRWGSEEDYNKNPEENNDRVEGGFYGSYNFRWGSEEDYNNSPKENSSQAENEFDRNLRKKTKNKSEKLQKNFKKSSDSKPSTDLKVYGVNKEHWSVRFISNGGCSLKGFFGHAAILIEGYDENHEEFKVLTDLIEGVQKTGIVRILKYPGKCRTKMGNKIAITLKDAEERVEKYHAKSERWIVSAWKINRMLQKIEKEATYINAKTYIPQENVYFNLFAYSQHTKRVIGKKIDPLEDTIYQNLKNEEAADNIPHQWNYTETNDGDIYEIFEPDNCTSWAARKLEMLGIELKINIGKKIPSMPRFSAKSYTQNSLKEDSVPTPRPFKQKKPFKEVKSANEGVETSPALEDEKKSDSKNEFYNLKKSDYYIPEDEIRQCCPWRKSCAIL